MRDPRVRTLQVAHTSVPHVNSHSPHLVAHMRLVSGERAFKCNVCAMVFGHPSPIVVATHDLCKRV
jgi:hypothetical protein